VAVTGTDPDVEATAKEKATQLARRAKGLSKEQFADLARETSEDADTKAKGGELPMLRKPTFFGPAFDAAVFGAEVGVLAEPVRSFRGYHVVFLHEKMPMRVRPIEEVRDQLRDQLLTQRKAEYFQTYVANLQKSAKQDIRLKN
jgi:parvulin-like peptidyl-prolyl isomerase